MPLSLPEFERRTRVWKVSRRSADVGAMNASTQKPREMQSGTSFFNNTTKIEIVGLYEGQKKRSKALTRTNRATNEASTKSASPTQLDVQ